MNSKNASSTAPPSRVVKLNSPPAKRDGESSLPPHSDARPADDFPRPSDACFYGLAGDIARTIQPLTEADPLALLMNVLTAFGSMAGKNCYTCAGGGRHYGNLFWASVGKTSKGRKGTAWQTVRPIFKTADTEWLADCVISGLSTGEGLIHQIRDTANEDPGIDDKRLLSLEEELARPFKVMRRDGNTLSPVLRSAWDGGKLRVTTKFNGETATDPHVSVIGHISREELAGVLTEDDIFNGTANRFLWLAVRRSQCLPETPEIPEPLLAPFANRMRDALAWANSEREISRDNQARSRWQEIYRTLSDFADERSGLTGCILARAEAQVTRLSLLMAMLDQSPVIHLPHLNAALALWQYAEDSARWIFHQSGTGNRDADAILAHLRAAGRPVARTEISRAVFNGNRPAEKIAAALAVLTRLRFAASCPYQDGHRGEFWQST